MSETAALVSTSRLGPHLPLPAKTTPRSSMREPVLAQAPDGGGELALALEFVMGGLAAGGAP